MESKKTFNSIDGMKRGLTGIIALSILLLLWHIDVYAELTGQVSVDRSTQSLYENGTKTSETDTLFTNVNLTFSRPVTLFSQYSLYLRARLRDTDTTDETGTTTTQSIKELEPALQFTMNNPFYQLRLSYQVNEKEIDSDTSSDGKKRDQLFSSYFSLTPYELPAFYIQLYKQKIDDEIGAGKEDLDSLRYTLSSYYKYNYKGLRMEYNITYTDINNKTPEETIFETRSKLFSGLYEVAYSRSLWQNALSLFGSYKGVYTWNKNERFSSETGDVLVERSAFGGFYALGNVVQPDVDLLTNESNLVDNDLTTGIGSINLSNDRYHNIGIGVSSLDTVTKLYVYVNKDVTADANLSNIANWKAYKTNVNGGTWTEIPISSLNITLYDPLNDIYRYEFEFLTPQSASYFKVVNLDTITPIIPNVLVTEIEAYGVESVPTTGEISDITKSLQEEVNLSARYRPREDLQFTLNMYTKRTDTDMSSFFDAFGKVFQNIVSDPGTDSSSEERIEVTRSYGVGARWDAHRLLTTEARFQRYELIDNLGEKDFISNSYTLSFISTPIETFTATLTFLRTDSFEFDSKTSTSNSVILSINTKLYWNVTLTNDIGYRETTSFASDTKTESTFISGILDAKLTDKVSSYLHYNLNWITTDTESYTSHGATLILNYRPGRLFNVTGTLSAKKVKEDTTTSEGISVGWRPVRKIKLDVSYLHSNIEPGPTTIDTYSSTGVWYITKFLDFRLTYGYTKTVNSEEEESYNIRFLLNGRI